MTCTSSHPGITRVLSEWKFNGTHRLRLLGGRQHCFGGGCGGGHALSDPCADPVVESRIQTSRSPRDGAWADLGDEGGDAGEAAGGCYGAKCRGRAVVDVQRRLRPSLSHYLPNEKPWRCHKVACLVKSQRSSDRALGAHVLPPSVGSVHAASGCKHARVVLGLHSRWEFLEVFT